MEVIVDLLDLCEVFVLHSATSLALGTVLTGVWEQDLVDYYVMNINFVLGKLDGQSFCLVHREELWDANSYKGCFGRVLELLIDILNLGLHGIDTIKHALLHLLRVLLFATLIHHILHLAKHASELVLELDELDEALLEDVREVEQAQGVTRGRRIENDQREVVLVERLHHFAEARRLVNARHRPDQILHETH